MPAGWAQQLLPQAATSLADHVSVGNVRDTTSCVSAQQSPQDDMRAGSTRSDPKRYSQDDVKSCSLESFKGLHTIVDHCAGDGFGVRHALQHFQKDLLIDLQHRSGRVSA